MPLPLFSSVGLTRYRSGRCPLGGRITGHRLEFRDMMSSSCSVRGFLPIRAFRTVPSITHVPYITYVTNNTFPRGCWSRTRLHAYRSRRQGPSFVGSSTSSSAAPLRKAGIVWYRNDLRVHDHEAMMKANGGCTSVLPVYCFDPREYVQRARGRYQKTGPYRAGFTIDAVQDLRGQVTGDGE